MVAACSVCGEIAAWFGHQKAAQIWAWTSEEIRGSAPVN